jgi:hypothetical protein
MKLSQLSLQIPKNYVNGLESGSILCNWSGGASSAVACFIAYKHFKDACKFVHMRTNLEHPDTYRFMFDYQQRLGVQIEQLQSEKFFEPEDVWDHYGGMNFATGAPCSSELKRDVGKKYRKQNTLWSEVLGFDASETKRIRNMTLNYPEINPVYPLAQNNLNKNDVFSILDQIGLRPPVSYTDFKNNNCLGHPDSPKGGCVQGGIGYWKRIQQIYPKKFSYMAAKEHELTDRKGRPVTLLMDQANNKKVPIFLLPHQNYPDIKTIADKKGRYKVESFECHGFCNTDGS